MNLGITVCLRKEGTLAPFLLADGEQLGKGEHVALVLSERSFKNGWDFDRDFLGLSKPPKL